MNTSIRTSFAGFALSCILLCSTTPVQTSTGKNIAKGLGYTAMTIIGSFIDFEGAKALYGCYEDSNYGDIKFIISILLSGTYTAQRNIRNLIELYKQTYHHKYTDSKNLINNTNPNHYNSLIFSIPLLISGTYTAQRNIRNLFNNTSPNGYNSPIFSIPLLISVTYTAQKNIRNLIELYKQTHQHKSESAQEKTA